MYWTHVARKAAWLQTPMITRFGVVVLPLSLLFAAASYLENLGDQYLLVWRTYWHPARRRTRKGETKALFERLKLEGFKHLPTILSLKIPIDFPGQIWPKTLFCFGIMPSIKKPRRRRRTLFVSRWWPLTLLMKPWHFGRSQFLRAAMVTEIKKATLPKQMANKKRTIGLLYYTYKDATAFSETCGGLYSFFYQQRCWISISSRLAFNDLVPAVASVATRQQTNIDIGPHRSQKDVKRIQKRSNWSTLPLWVYIDCWKGI